MGTAFLLVQSSIAGTYCNLGNHKSQNASLDTRKEGWTEIWGDESATKPQKSSDSIRAIDDDSIANVLATPHPQPEIIISQYRPAWFEQTVLKMANIPFVVKNSSYISNEATGPLPFLRDTRPKEPPVLVGRHQKKVKGSQENAILAYLISQRGVNLDKHLEKPADLALSTSFTSLISSDLASCLSYLRYTNSDAWERVYRKCHISATTPHSDNMISHLGGRFQAWCERALALQKISSGVKFASTEEATEKASEYYRAIELQLSSHEGSFLLGYKLPSLVDAVLFAHLAEALCDVHLVVALASFPKILSYFERIYTQYFSSGKTDPYSLWNMEQNILNPFHCLPMNAQGGALLPNDVLSVPFQKGVRESVLDAARIRHSEPRPVADSKKSALYKWRMGGDPFEKEDLTSKQAENPNWQKIKKDQARNDQIWISVVIGSSLLALFLMQKPKGKK